MFEVIIITSTLVSFELRYTIYHEYIVKEHIILHQDFEDIADRSYELYDVNNSVKHIVNRQKTERTVVPILGSPDGRWVADCKSELISELTYHSLDGYKCLVEKSVVSSTPLGKDGYTKITYFAEIPFLEQELNASEMLRFCGFKTNEYHPFIFDIHEFLEFDQGRVRSEVKRTTITKSMCDTSIIALILSIPVSE